MSDSLAKRIADTKKALGKSEEKAVQEKESINRKSEETKVKVDRRKFNKGHPGSGRKPSEQTLIKRGLRQLMDEHANEEVDIEITDKKTGKRIVIKKPRSVILLETLYKKAFIDKDIGAIKEWFDRAVGKAPQPIRGDANDDTPIRQEIDINGALDKAYGDD